MESPEVSLIDQAEIPITIVIDWSKGIPDSKEFLIYKDQILDKVIENIQSDCKQCFCGWTTKSKLQKVKKYKRENRVLEFFKVTQRFYKTTHIRVVIHQ